MGSNIFPFKGFTHYQEGMAADLATLKSYKEELPPLQFQRNNLKCIISKNTMINISIHHLTEEKAHTYQAEFIHMLQQIPLVTFSKDELFATKKGDRIMYEKWRHSFYAFDNEQHKPVGILLSYERVAEDNALYPKNCIYLSELAIDPTMHKQGIATALLTHWIENSKKHGFYKLTGQPTYVVQTNSAPWNNHVQQLYIRAGFIQRESKTYENRTDFIFVQE